MKSYNITKEQAKLFLLKYQGLLPPNELPGKEGIMEFIKRVGCIQFDPLNIVGYNPELVLQSRIKNFDTKMLQELLYCDRSLIDYWDKNMAIYSTEDWPYFKRIREAYSNNLRHKSKSIIEIIPEIRKSLVDKGPLSSLDLNYEKTVDWSWAPTSISRAALESMYFCGELIIHHKVNTRRIYDFTEKHIPHKLLSMPDPNPSEEGFFAWYIHRRIGSVGLLWNKHSDAWLGMPKIKSSERSSIFNRLINEEKILEVAITETDTLFYITKESAPILESVMYTPTIANNASILAPLDNLLWDRKLIRILFDFEYVWEVYKPLKDRKYGYYVLPIIYRDQFIGRFEPGIDRKTNTLIIKKWWWESNINRSEELDEALTECFSRFLHYLKASKIEIDSVISKNNSIKFLKKIKNK